MALSRICEGSTLDRFLACPLRNAPSCGVVVCWLVVLVRGFVAMLVDDAMRIRRLRWRGSGLRFSAPPKPLGRHDLLASRFLRDRAISYFAIDSAENRRCDPLP